MIYLPFSDFEKCAHCFDSKTLKKQCLFILRLLKHYHRTRKSEHFRRSYGEIEPSQSLSSLWRNHKDALVEYGMILAQERLNRGFNENFLLAIAAFRWQRLICYPKWLGWEPLHASHRSALLKEEGRRILRKGINCLSGRHLNDYLTFRERLKREDAIFEQLDGYTINSLCYSLMTTFSILLDSNFYRQQGFIESFDLPLVWPYTYVEEFEESLTRPTPRVQRSRF